MLLGIAVAILVVDRFLLDDAPQGPEPEPADEAAMTERDGTAAPGASPSTASGRQSPEIEPNSIAVMSFQNLGGDPEQEFFSDGMTHDLITDLSRISGLFVVAASSVFKYKDGVPRPQQVADELGVRCILEGSVPRAGHNIRIDAQLVDTSNGRQLRAERYGGTLTDVLPRRTRWRAR